MQSASCKAMGMIGKKSLRKWATFTPMRRSYSRQRGLVVSNRDCLHEGPQSRYQETFQHAKAQCEPGAISIMRSSSRAELNQITGGKSISRQHFLYSLEVGASRNACSRLGSCTLLLQNSSGNVNGLAGASAVSWRASYIQS